MTFKHIQLALAAAMACLAQPALAQSTTGHVDVTGSVAPRCGVAGSGSSTIFGQTIGPGELAAADGTLHTGIDSRIDYTAVASASGINASDLSVTGGAGTSSAVDVFAGSIGATLSEASTPRNGVLVAGSSIGNVSVTLLRNVVL